MTPLPDFWNLDCVSSLGRNDEHRWWLARDLMAGKLVKLRYEMAVFLMLNPSRARGAGVGDPTQRKCDGFAERLLTRRYGLMNLFTRSTPYPEDLFTFGYDNAVGEGADEWLTAMFQEAARCRWPVIAAWGKPSKLSVKERALVAQRSLDVTALAAVHGVTMKCLKYSDDGLWPRHPLMLGYEEARLMDWRPPV